MQIKKFVKRSHFENIINSATHFIIIMRPLFKILITLLFTCLISCTKPSNSEIISVLNERADQDLPLNCVDVSNIKVDKKGLKQEIDGNSYWIPVRVNVDATCIVSRPGSGLSPWLFDPDLERTIRIRERGQHKTLEMEYKFFKNEYNEWVAELR